jgi:hypothetical protein
MPISDYTDDLEQSAQTGEWQTGDVPAEDINRVTHRLRNQAKKLALEIEIRTNRQEGKVSFKCLRKDQIQTS